MGHVTLRRSGTSREALLEVRETNPEFRVESGGLPEGLKGPPGGSGGPPGSLEWLERPSRRFGTGREALMEDRDGSGGRSIGPTGGPERLERPSQKSGTGQEALP